MAVAPSICPSFASGMYMQDFTSQMCASAPTPSGTDFFPIGFLIDRRDNKKYEVRKFADGNCWMVDNLAYGGADLNNGIDGCLKTTFCGNGYNDDGSCWVLANAPGGVGISTVDKIAPGLYGDCRYPYDNLATVDVNNYGYFYNWQAAVQNDNAYVNHDYQPSQPTQGICPDGWYLPTGGPSGQFQALHVAVGSPKTGFWQPGGNWKGVYNGAAEVAGSIIQQQGQADDPTGRSWSSTQQNAMSAYDGFYKTIEAAPSYNNQKNMGYAVRCVKMP